MTHSERRATERRGARAAEYLLASDNPAMQKLLKMARDVAPTPTTVLITGESGTGKEVVARFIHAASGRAGGPFVALNCGAIPSGLVESELFGHEKGSFSGAHERRFGKFELAQGGTLLLDEVSELPAEMQSKLLRVLQEHELYRVGGSSPVLLDVRVIATSNRDLRAMVRQGSFRQDLYYRLNVFPLALPPLRSRMEDVPGLAATILGRLWRRFGYEPLQISGPAMVRLLDWSWPGNIRELNNVLERAMILSGGDHLLPDHILLDNDVASPEPASAPSVPMPEPEPEPARGQMRATSLRELERSTILRTLRECNGNRTHASERLGISLRTLRNRLREYRGEGVSIPESARMAG